MKTVINVGTLSCLCSKSPTSNKVTYILYPFESLQDWVEDAVEEYDTSIVVISNMDWDNDLTPWPAKGVPAGSPDFQGKAQELLQTIKKDIIPAAEKELGINNPSERDLVGVSLSGLFTLWQWALCDEFKSIASMSGSFWYEGFTQWFEQQKLTGKTGKAFFLLGKDEPHSSVKEFDSVGVNTLSIVDYLKSQNIPTEFIWVPGNHFSDPIGRLNLAMKGLQG